MTVWEALGNTDFQIGLLVILAIGGFLFCATFALFNAVWGDK